LVRVGVWFMVRARAMITDIFTLGTVLGLGLALGLGVGSELRLSFFHF
jgi:hypothetical protein